MERTKLCRHVSYRVGSKQRNLALTTASLCSPFFVASLLPRVPVSRSVRTMEKASKRQAESAASGVRDRKGERLPDPARRPPAFSIVRTDREPRTGYFSVLMKVQMNIQNCWHHRIQFSVCLLVFVSMATVTFGVILVIKSLVKSLV